MYSVRFFGGNFLKFLTMPPNGLVLISPVRCPCPIDRSPSCRPTDSLLI